MEEKKHYTLEVHNMKQSNKSEIIGKKFVGQKGFDEVVKIYEDKEKK